jgi:oxygen-independent coproporphyrinogen-3 oxidase
VFSKQVFKRYVDRVVEDIAQADEARLEMQIPRFARDDKAKPMGERAKPVVEIGPRVDSIYLGGGTPTLLEAAELVRLFTAVRDNFEVAANAEVTVECAPGTLAPEVIDTLVRCGVNRVSLGVQSFIDKEASSVGRLHTCAVTLEEIARLRAAGIENINIDLIAGLPHQTRESWEESLAQLIDTGVPHASIYMLEVDEDSRLGRELIAGGTKYHAHFVPDDDLTADLYERACERLNAAGIAQYEISNFARAGYESTHNLKYWTRQPYLGFGVDAHSMLPANAGVESARFSTPDNLERYISAEPSEETPVTHSQAMEEAFFLGLRLNRGIDLEDFAARYGEHARTAFQGELEELISAKLVDRGENCLRLTARGRLISNEVFTRFLSAGATR